MRVVGVARVLKRGEMGPWGGGADRGIEEGLRQALTYQAAGQPSDLLQHIRGGAQPSLVEEDGGGGGRRRKR